MRTISAAQQVVLDSGVQGEHVRVSVKDGGGTFRDLTSYPGYNAVKTVQIQEKVDQPHMTCSIALLRELGKLSLAPLMQASGLNRGFAPSASYVPLLALTREVKVETAIVPMDRQPASGDWFEIFRGRIDTIDAGKGRDVELSCRGLAGRLAQQYVKTELVYSFAAVAGTAVPLRVWEPGLVVTTSPVFYVLPATRGDADPGLNKFLVCSQAGTTGSTEPVWTTGANQTDGTAKWDYVGATTTAGNDVEQIMQNILDDNKLSGDPTVTLYVPASPGWEIRQFLQARTFTLDAVVALAHQIGWDVRYKWRSTDFQFTLYEPNRAFVVGMDAPDFSFDASDYSDPDALSVDIAEIRNSWRVVYADRADLWPDGTPKRKEVNVADSTSIAKYGELWAEIQEDENSNIDSSTEATAFANAALSDCKEPTAHLSTELRRGFPWVELNDMIKFTANGLHFDADQTLAVTGWTQSFEGGKLKTKLELRGLPTIGAKVHIAKTIHREHAPKGTSGHQLSLFQGVKTPKMNFLDTVGGTRVQLDLSTDKRALLGEYEVHLSPSPGFTPDDTTLKGLTKSTTLEVSDLLPGATYYGKTIQRGFNASKLVRGQPSAEASFVAGQASPQHLEMGAWWGRQPLNGGFESMLNPVGPPDHWEMISGDWGTEIDEVTGSDVRSGERCLTIDPSASSADIRGETFQIEQGRYYNVSWFFKDNDGGTGSVELYMKTYSDDGVTQVQDLSLDLVHSTSDPSILNQLWQRRGTIVFITSTNDRWARIGVRKASFSSPTSTDFLFDSIEIKPQDMLVVGEQTQSIGSKTIASGTPADFGSEANVNLDSAEVGSFQPNENDIVVLFTTTCFSDTAATGVEFFPRLTDIDGNTFDGTPLRFYFNAANTHHQFSGVWNLTRPQLASFGGAQINVKMRWSRFTGSGTITTDANDSCSFVVK
jgi:hypothetical protein